MKKYLTLILAIIIFAVVHEGAHALVAWKFAEYQTFRVHPYGLEVVFKTPVAEREGVKWGFISATSNVLTLLLGYLMFFFRVKMARLRSSFLSALGYWLILLFLILDAFNLSVGPFIYGGDIGGIVAGFGINRYLVQVIFFMVFLINRELIAQNLLPLYGVTTKHFLFQPWLRQKDNR
jgi:hypothetical protein